MSDRVASGTSTTDTAVVCGITLPDFSGTGFVGGETYGIRFPSSLFDSGFILKFSLPGTIEDSSPTAAFDTAASAVLIGLTLADHGGVALDDLDPGRHRQGHAPRRHGQGSDRTARGWRQRDLRAHSGRSVRGPRERGVRRHPPGDGPRRPRERLQPPFRNRDDTQDSERHEWQICDRFARHWVWAVGGGGDCSSTQTSFVDGTQPVFSPTAGTAFTSVRMPGATCAAVRQALP